MTLDFVLSLWLYVSKINWVNFVHGTLIKPTLPNDLPQWESGKIILLVHRFSILLQVKFVVVFYMPIQPGRFEWSHSPNTMVHKFISWSNQFLISNKRICWSVSAFFTKFKSLWNKLSSLELQVTIYGHRKQISTIVILICDCLAGTTSQHNQNDNS